MKIYFILSLFILNTYAGTQPVDKVDLQKYMGNWYEIASIPQRFTKDCVCVRARYRLKADGHVEVYNSCNRGSPTGKFTDVLGKAKVEDKNTNAKLKVAFFWPFYADYWIIGLAQDYRYAIVSNGDGDTLWIISRTPDINPEDLKQAYNIIEKNGIDTKLIKFTDQAGCTYPEDK